MENLKLFSQTILPILAFVITLSGGIIALLNYLKSNAVKRAEFITRLYNSIDGEIGDIFYKLIYNKIKIDNFNQFDENLISLDKLLGKFDEVYYYYTKGVIKDSDLEYFAYEIALLYENDTIKNYINFLDKEDKIYKKMSSDSKPFTGLKELFAIVNEKYLTK